MDDESGRWTAGWCGMGPHVPFIATPPSTFRINLPKKLWDVQADLAHGLSDVCFRGFEVLSTEPYKEKDLCATHPDRSYHIKT